jgi:hypothetical protein
MVKNLYFLSKTKILTILYKSKDLKAQLLNILNYSKLSIDETNIDSGFAMSRQSGCPRSSGSGDNNLAPLDLQTPTVFENNYYKNLVVKKGLLQSDQELFNGGATDALVQSYISRSGRTAEGLINYVIKRQAVCMSSSANAHCVVCSRGYVCNIFLNFFHVLCNICLVYVVVNDRLGLDYSTMELD